MSIKVHTEYVFQINYMDYHNCLVGITISFTFELDTWQRSVTNSLYQDLHVLIYLHAHHINTASLDHRANFCTYCPYMWLKMATTSFCIYLPPICWNYRWLQSHQGVFLFLFFLKTRGSLHSLSMAWNSLCRLLEWLSLLSAGTKRESQLKWQTLSFNDLCKMHLYYDLFYQ